MLLLALAEEGLQIELVLICLWPRHISISGSSPFLPVFFNQDQFINNEFIQI
jgi:hypothetical protein